MNLVIIKLGTVVEKNKKILIAMDALLHLQ